MLAFGIGAGCSEVIYVLVSGITAKRDPEREAAWARGAAVSLCVRYQVPIERLFALVGHVGSRGVVYAGLHAKFPECVLLLFLAVFLFTAVDGVAYYGHLRGWNWSEPSVCRRTHGFFAFISVIEFGTFLAVFRSV